MDLHADRALPELLEFAHSLADASGDIILPHFRTASVVTDKGKAGFDPVTDADRGAEAEIRRLIEAKFPDHAIAGEEFSHKPGQSSYEWVLDPIDGTRAFITGLPVWGTLIALNKDARPILGIMDQPFLHERFWNGPAGAMFRDRGGERPISTRPCGALKNAILGCTTPDMFEDNDLTRFQALSSSCRMTRYGADCYMYCMLAMGFVDIVAEAGLKPFDIAALIPIIEAAGGKVTSWNGGNPAQGGDVVATGDPALHEAALQALKP